MFMTVVIKCHSVNYYTFNAELTFLSLLMSSCNNKDILNNVLIMTTWH